MSGIAPCYVIARVLNGSGDRDYLSGWNARWGTEATPSPVRAMRFGTRERAEAARKRARRLVPVWFGSAKPIPYEVVEIDPEAPMRGCFGRVLPPLTPAQLRGLATDYLRFARSSIAGANRGNDWFPPQTKPGLIRAAREQLRLARKFRIAAERLEARAQGSR